MRFRFGLVLVLAVAACFFGAGNVPSKAVGADEETKAKHTIKEVMKIGHNKESGVLGKVLSGNATDDEKKLLLDLYISMLESKPKKGEMDSWQKLAGGTALAAAKVVVGREGALDELKEASNCAACHKLHK
ncbi:MAG: hypothetical protein KDB22_14255 [Planctomycetales bacterium]|nr:hypothetical protein [Planctomycetales bacterium]